MKIAVYHNLPSGGAKRALYTQVRHLRDRGHQIECWTPVTSRREYLPLSDLIPVHVLPYKYHWAIWHRLCPYSLDIYQKLWCNTRSLASFAKRAAAEINHKAFDVLFSANCRYQAAPPIANYVDCPSVFYCQEPYRAFYETDTGSPLLMNRQHRIREEFFNAQAFNTILVNSHYSKGRIDSVYDVNSTVNYLGIDTDHFKPSGEPRENYVIGVGAIQPHKRIELAINAVALLEKKPTLLWVGNMCSGSYRKKLEQLALQKEVNLELHVSILDDKLVNLLGRAMLFIYTSRQEPFGLTPLEANACGTPVVAVREGGMCETIQDGVNGHLCAPTPEVIASAIAPLLTDPERITQLGISAREYIERQWSWDTRIDEIENIFLTTINTQSN